MEGIILTRRAASGASSTAIPVELTIATGDTEIVETFDGSDCPFVRWQVSVADRTSATQSTQYFVLTTVHDFEGNVDWNISSKLGNKANTNVDVAVTIGTPNTNIVFSLTNNESHDLDICATRV